MVQEVLRYFPLDPQLHLRPLYSVDEDDNVTLLSTEKKNLLTIIEERPSMVLSI